MFGSSSPNVQLDSLKERYTGETRHTAVSRDGEGSHVYEAQRILLGREMEGSASSGGGTYRQRKVDGVEVGSWYEAAEIEARELDITRSEFLRGDHPSKWVDISQITPPISEPDFVLCEPPEEEPKQVASAEGSSTSHEKGSIWMVTLGVVLSLFDSPKAKRRVLPPNTRRTIIDLKAEHPPLNLKEIANFCGKLFGRRPDGHTVNAVLEENAIPARPVKRFAKYTAVAAHELAAIGDRIPSQTGEDVWARFVSESEEAISREHTLWRASRTANSDH